VRRDGEPVVRVLGWSFPQDRVPTSPLVSLPQELRAGRHDDGAPDELLTVGLLHCDLGGGASPYAPVAERELTRLGPGFAGWFLGHVHGATIRQGEFPVGYLGSLVGMDAGETGPHGPWLATRRGATWQLEQSLLSPVRWEAHEVDVSGCERREEVEEALLRGLREVAARLEGETSATRAVGVRLTLVGRTAVPENDLSRLAGGEHRDRATHPEGDTLYFLDRVLVRTRKRRDLDALARGSDPLAVVARRLLLLEEGGEACEALVRRARPALEAAADDPRLWRAGDLELTDEGVREHLRRAASRLLDEFLAQKGELARKSEGAEA
jgi:hypothetical protein